MYNNSHNKLLLVYNKVYLNNINNSTSKTQHNMLLIFFIMCIFTDKGEVFGWGNSEYGQLLLNDDKYQVNTPKNLPLNKTIGNIIDIGTTGSACIALNGKKNIITILYFLIFYIN